MPCVSRVFVPTVELSFVVLCRRAAAKTPSRDSGGARMSRGITARMRTRVPCQRETFSPDDGDRRRQSCRCVPTGLQHRAPRSRRAGFIFHVSSVRTVDTIIQYNFPYARVRAAKVMTTSRAAEWRVRMMSVLIDVLLALFALLKYFQPAGWFCQGGWY